RMGSEDGVHSVEVLSDNCWESQRSIQTLAAELSQTALRLLSVPHNTMVAVAPLACSPIAKAVGINEHRATAISVLANMFRYRRRMGVIIGLGQAELLAKMCRLECEGIASRLHQFNAC